MINTQTNSAETHKIYMVNNAFEVRGLQGSCTHIYTETFPPDTKQNKCQRNKQLNRNIITTDLNSNKVNNSLYPVSVEMDVFRLFSLLKFALEGETALLLSKLR